MQRFLSVLVVVSMAPGSARAAAKPFVVVDGTAPLPAIVVQYDPKAGTGFDAAKAAQLPWYNRSDAALLRDAVAFLHEGVERMTGKTLRVISRNDLTRGLVLTTLAAAPAAVRADATVREALRKGSDLYNDREAFFIRTEPQRILIVANHAAGLCAGVAELLESVGYEVLGLGPSWVHVPRDKRDRLVFNLETSGRPGFYIRGLHPTSGQGYGVGTIMPDPKHPLHAPDEPITTSWARWAVGARIRGQSMPGFPGHALQAYHRAVVERMKATGSTDGFLVPRATLGRDGDRPPAGKDNAGQLWINTDAAGQRGAGKVFISNGKTWAERSLTELGVNLDLSVPLVRQVILTDLKKKAEAHFAAHPNDIFVFGTEPEDGGGYGNLARLLRNKNWYPDYLKAQGIAFGRPYVLHGYQGINQPRETWDPAAAADTVFGFNNWLLREFDRWIDARPAAERMTATGKSKKERLRCSLYSYNYHDIPPSFNLDPRIRVMIAGYPKHRGMGKWKRLVTQLDLARAYQKLLPREPSGDYRIISLAYYWDPSPEGIPPSWSNAAARIADDLHTTYQAGIRAINYETDFNFGKFGLGYYLTARMLWSPSLKAADLDALRNRWLQRAFGSGWREMKAYHDFLLPGNYPVNAPNSWARAIRLIDAADAKIDPAREPDAKRRLDEVKQYWYFHYLLQSGKAVRTNEEMQTFAWKGQMSYQVAMHVVMRKIFATSGVREAIPEKLRRGPAHFTAEETRVWWQQVKAFWPLVPVASFADAVLADGTRGKDVDTNDLTRIKTFRLVEGGNPFLYNSGYMKPPGFVTVARAGEEIGFQLFWPALSRTDRYYVARDVPYGIRWWDARARTWQPVVDRSLTAQPSEEITDSKGKRLHVVRVRHRAARAGTYRFEVGRGGNLARLTHLGHDPANGTFARRLPLTFVTHAEGLTQDPVWIYLPRGTKSLDLEVWDGYGPKKLTLFRAASMKKLTPTRTIDISKRGTHRVRLEAEETGMLARIAGNGFAFPFLYSVPTAWAKSPAELVVPRAVAKADGLEIDE